MQDIALERFNGSAKRTIEVRLAMLRPVLAAVLTGIGYSACGVGARAISVVVALSSCRPACAFFD